MVEGPKGRKDLKWEEEEQSLECYVGVASEDLLHVYLPFDHVGVDVHVETRISAQFQQGSDVVFG